MANMGGNGSGGGMNQIVSLLHEDRQQSQAQQAEAQNALMQMLQSQVEELRAKSGRKDEEWDEAKTW